MPNKKDYAEVNKKTSQQQNSLNFEDPKLQNKQRQTHQQPVNTQIRTSKNNRSPGAPHMPSSATSLHISLNYRKKRPPNIISENNINDRIFSKRILNKLIGCLEVPLYYESYAFLFLICFLHISLNSVKEVFS